jgi:hypothetical protein
MTKGNNLVKVFTGSEVSVILLKGELEENGIAAIIRNEYQSGITAGFLGGVPSAIDLYINESDFKQVEPIINEFVKNNNE